MNPDTETPCRSICVVDPVTGNCIGCGRSRDEVARWSQLTDDERSRIRAELPGRLRQMTSRATRGRGRREP